MLKFLELNGVDAVIVDKTTTINVIANRSVTLQPQNDRYFSVFSLDNECTGVSEKGGKYLISDVKITNDFPIGVSNEFTGKNIIADDKNTVAKSILNKCPLNLLPHKPRAAPMQNRIIPTRQAIDSK
jgi:thiamine pyrophosphokinase